MSMVSEKLYRNTLRFVDEDDYEHKNKRKKYF